jgi:hypothetical protein
MGSTGTIGGTHQCRFTMHRNSTVVSIAILTLLTALILYPAHRILAQASAQVSIEPSFLQIRTGETAALTLELHNASQVFGFEAQLSFDPDILQMVDQDPGTDGIQVAHGSFFPIEQGFLVANRVDNDTGQILYAFTLLAPAAPLEGQGSLLSFEFEAISPGHTSLNLDTVILASIDGKPLPASLQDGEVIVVNPSGDRATPTTLSSSPTNSPTQTRVPSMTPVLPTLTLTHSETRETPNPNTAEPAGKTATTSSPTPVAWAAGGDEQIQAMDQDSDADLQGATHPDLEPETRPAESGWQPSWEILIAVLLVLALVILQLVRYVWFREKRNGQS